MNSVTIPVWNNLGFTNGTADVYLYDANGSGGLPGSQMAALGSAPMTSFSSAGYQNFTISSLSVNLQPSTNYWIVMGGTNLPASYTIGMTNLSTGAGPGSIGSAVFSGGRQGQSVWFIIGSISASPVPEPSTPALAAIAAGVALLVARRRNPGTTRQDYSI